MKSKIIKIGNSKGVRIPANILKELNIKENINMEIEKNRLVISPVNSPREGWKKAAMKLHENKDDELLIDDALDEWDDLD
jgi:antitoxin MazE